MNQQFLGAFPLSGLLGQHEDDAPPARPLMEAQQDELLARYAAAHAPRSVEPGMLVRQKHGLGFLKDQENTALILWRMLDLSNPLDLAMAIDFVTTKTVSTVDCLVALTAIDNGQSVIVMIPHDTSHLEPVT